jgi:hypothetical protein
MADYYPLISRAVAGLEKNNGENRRALYERARAALLAQLRGVTPPLPESDITRERLALEESIRKVEAEAARQFDQSRSQATQKARKPEPERWEEEPRPASPPRPAAPRSRAPEPDRRDESPRPAARAANPPAPGQEGAPRRPSPPAPGPLLGEHRYSDTVFDRPLPEHAPERPAPPAAPRHPLRRPAAERRPVAEAGTNDLRHVVSEADELGAASARAAKSARDAYAAIPAETGEYERHEPYPREYEGPHAAPDEAPPPMLEPAISLDDARTIPPRVRHAPPPPLEHEDDFEEEEAPPRRSYRDIVKGFVAVVVIIAIGGLLLWQWPNMVALYRTLRAPPTEVAKDTSTPSSKKVQERVEPSGTPQPQPQPAPGPAVAQKAVLYEQDTANPEGKRYVGSAVWRTQTASPGPGQPPELVIRADIEVPERKFSMTFTLRRDSPQQNVTSHTIEIMFKLPADFSAGGISNVPGILMKQSETPRGVPLIGQAVRVTDRFFLIGLSNVEADRLRNIQMLKERSWFDIPLVYTNNSRAILAFEKGTPGERIFAEAFKAWKQ